MRVPTIYEANKFLEEGGKLNPGPWVQHSTYVAQAAKNISQYHSKLDPEVSYVLGLLHDIGRRAGVHQMRHAIDGYTFLIELEFDFAARICITHSFPDKNINSVFGEWDCTEKELKFVADYLDTIEYNEYDLLIQLCDALALPTGFCLLEKRMIDVALRYGTNSYTIDKWKLTFDIKRHFEDIIGCSLYTLLPGVLENTFGAGINKLK